MWKKALFIAADLLLAAYTVVAVTTFNKPDVDVQTCTKVNIGIDDNSSNAFIDATEIKHRLEATGLDPVGRPMGSINPRKVEEMLMKSAFVKTADCYKTHDGHVFISITQRLPVIRIKADNGDDYYVDDKNSIMPKSNYTSDLIIATGNISRTFATNCVSPLGKALMANDLWKNLVEQVHVTQDRGIEIVPRIGDHVVYLGHLPATRKSADREQAIADFVDTKLNRLMKFYKYGLTQAGWNKYDYINVEFDNQIICKRHSATHHEEAQAPAVAPVQSADTVRKSPAPAKPETNKETTASKQSKPSADKEKPSTAKTASSADRQKSSASKEKSTTSKEKPKADKQKKSEPATGNKKRQ